MKGDTNIQHETKIEQIVLNYLDQDPDIRAILEIIRLLLNETAEDKYVIIATHDPAVYNEVDVIIDMKDIGDNV